MQILTSEAIVLDVIDLHEADRIATFITRDAGRKRGVAKGARRPHSRFAGQLRPLTTLRLTWVEKGGNDLVRISTAEMLRSAHPLQNDLEGLLLGSYLADHLIHFAQEFEETDLYFRLLDSTLLALLAGVDRPLAARYFEAWVLRLSGVFPAPEGCPECGSDLGGGAALPPETVAVLCRGCAASGGGAADALEVTPAMIAWLRCIAGDSLVQMAQSQPPQRATLDGIEALCSAVRRSFLQHELKSYRVMRETLGSSGLTPSTAGN
jgi:DNA repair protein RecO (recombination protein O)